MVKGFNLVTRGATTILYRAVMFPIFLLQSGMMVVLFILVWPWVWLGEKFDGEWTIFCIPNWLRTFTAGLDSAAHWWAGKTFDRWLN